MIFVFRYFVPTLYRIFFVALAMLLITGMVLIVLGCALFSYTYSDFNLIVYFLESTGLLLQVFRKRSNEY